ncbi:hypothetical protein [Methylopila sp. M107]|uniref:hypothetical protein n=1 Tax=Methylopila sp. M107 TaxID=1101190 RepID=UPI00037BCA9E|nr:hypothetical protein [Methylopila sp. M107]
MGFRSFALGVLLAVASLVGGLTTEASAQSFRTWVSGVGDDVNPCSRTAPCKTFAGAISKTADGGMIDVLDPGAFGTVTITKGITIRGLNQLAGILAAGTNGVNINAPGKTVNLIGLQIDGVSTGLIGVNIISAAQVLISDCNIIGFTSGAGTGVKLASAATSRLTLNESMIFNTLIGLDVAPIGGANNGVLMERTLIDRTPTAAVRANGGNVAVIVRGSSVRAAIQLTSGAEFRSYGDNELPSGFNPTTTLPLR